MYKSTTTAGPDRKRTLLIVAIVVLFALGALVFWMNMQNKNAASISRERSSAAAANTIDNSPPTPEEVKAGDDQKDRNIERETAVTTPPAGSLDLRITDASQYDAVVEVRAYVTNNYEDGTCTAIFTKSGQPTVTTVSTAFKDASTTQCGANDTVRAKFSVAGDWQMTMNYKSTTDKAGSASKMVTIK